MVNVTQQSSLSVLALLPPPHDHINFHSAGEKGFVLAILQQNGKSLERLMNLPLSNNSTDHLTTNAISPVIWSSADKCCVLAKVLWQNYVLIDSVPCVSLSGLTWGLFMFLRRINCADASAQRPASSCSYCYHKISVIAHAVTCFVQQNEVKMINNLKRWSTPYNTPFPLVNDPQRRSPELHLKQYHRLNPCYEMKTAVNNSNTHDAESSPCISTPEISMSVYFSCF